MSLYEEFCQRIDSDSNYDNAKLARDLESIARKYIYRDKLINTSDSIYDETESTNAIDNMFPMEPLSNATLARPVHKIIAFNRSQADKRFGARMYNDLLKSIINS